MSNSYAADWAPTPAQLKEFFAQIESGRITKSKLQALLAGLADRDPLGLDLASAFDRQADRIRVISACHSQGFIYWRGHITRAIDTRPG